jgi:spore coat protein CotH
MTVRKPTLRLAALPPARGVVAQIFNLLYRRIVFCWPPVIPHAQARFYAAQTEGLMSTATAVCLAFMFTCGGLSSAAEILEHLKPAKDAVQDDIFAGTNVLRIRILIPNSGISALRNTGWGNGQERPKVKAIVREGTTVYTNVEIHLKGAAGSFRPVDDNPGFTLNFASAAPGQSFHGYHKISLNNSVQDHSKLSEKICRELFEAAGVPVPQAGFAKVELNGRNLGLRVMTEGWGKQFLKRYFNNAKGNLYDGGFCSDIDSRLQVNSGDNPQDHSGLLALIGAMKESDPARRFARLEETLDMERFLSFVAMDVMECDWDGYAMNHNNWRLFHDLDSNKMVFFPHGLDQMFGVERTSPECNILPRMQGRVARAVLATPEGKRRYFQRMSQLYTNVWHVEAILKRVDQLSAVIRPVLAETSSSSARYHDSEVENLKERISQRDESLRRQLASLVDQPKLEPSSSLHLSGWSRRTQTGAPAFRQEKTPDGHEALCLAANGNAIGSWRTRIMLEEGVYRFEGNVRTQGVKPSSGEPSGGAGLRISGGSVASELTGSQDWQKFGYPFRVQEGGREVEVICELRAARGEAWFDTSSLRVVRLR